MILTLVKLAGIFQIALSVGSLAIPKLLNWQGELSKVSTIIRQMFWIYAGYILIINLSFGLVSFFGAEELLQKSFFIEGRLHIYFFILVGENCDPVFLLRHKICTARKNS